MAVDKAALLTKRFGFQDIEVPGVGTVQVRSLTRAEALSVQGQEFEVEVLEQKLIAMAMVDPQLSEAEVKEWQGAATAGEIQIIVESIVRISGLEGYAAKAAYANFRQ